MNRPEFFKEQSTVYKKNSYYCSRQKKPGVQQVTSNLLSVQLYSMCRTKNLVYSGDLLSQAFCKIMWRINVPLLHPSHSPSPPKPLQIQPSSSLAALQKDGPGWFTSREFASSQIHDQRMRSSVCKYSIYFPSSNTFL